VSLSGLLQGHNGRGLEPQVLPKVLGDLADEALEGQLPDQELGRPLVLADLSQGTGLGRNLKPHGHRILVPSGAYKRSWIRSRHRFRDSAYVYHSPSLASGGGRGSELLPRGPTTSRPIRSSLGADHRYGWLLVGG